MSENIIGPAASTRSQSQKKRKSGNNNKMSKTKAEVADHSNFNQKLVSAFFPHITSNREESFSDTEVLIRSKLKK